MNYRLLWLALLSGPVALAQHAPTFSALPETSLTATVSTTAVSTEAGVRYQYQLVHLDDGRIWLAPAWRGQTKLEPARKFLNYDAAGEVDALLMQALNEMAAEGWELLEIRTVNQPVQAVQKVEKSLKFNDPNTPVYTGTTSIETSSQTRYLFRRALPRP
ncbi:hypothetical protein [Hymenobacter terricola]|uniref:hypothetical protein n=1 Tax=Hymenobacter terricola TaxID=2819236 RepID=UPI001B305F4D|nr:hypothetical protein [Hymenobacter terricola]